MKRAFVAIALVLAACAPSRAETDTWFPVDVTATPVAMPATIGRLQGRAGFVLESPQARFGGLSDLHVFEDGRLLAITDSGEWFLANLVIDPETGLPTGLANARMALMRDENGEPFPDKESGDAEGLAVLPDGRVAVSFEQSQTIRIYDLFGAGPMAPAQAGPILSDVQGLHPNRGLEALAALPEGYLLVGAEMGRRGRPNPVWLTPQDAPEPVSPTNSLDTPPGYGLTALEWDEGGAAVLALLRFYAPGIGVRIRIDICPPPLDAEPLRCSEIAALAPPLPVDNMEGIASLPLPEGGARLFLLSDNNYSEDQQTLLLVFDWPLPEPWQ